jgi:hypothetical protein
MDTSALQHVEEPIVTPVMRRLIRFPAVPAKTGRAFWPGVVVVTVTLGPPGVSVPPPSGGTF